MTREVKAMAGEHPVEAAIREGKIPESRRAHYMRLMAKKPKKTAKLLASMPVLLEPPEEMAAVQQYVEAGGNTAPAAPTASGPTAYPKEWVSAREARGRPAPGPGSITFEDPMAEVGAISPELM
jgi:hypothetical protein